MEWPDFKHPRPRPEPLRYVPAAWPESRLLPFLDENIPATPAFARVAESRRTRYAFAPLADENLGALMRLTCKVKESVSGRLLFPQSFRPVPSAGGIHPVHVVLHKPGAAVLHRYCPTGHGLHQLTPYVDTTALRAAMHGIVNAPQATLLLFVAEPGLTGAKYENAVSLVWRDAGVLLGMFAMAAEALALNFAPIGPTGEPWARSLFPGAPLVGVGAAFVGARP